MSIDKYIIGVKTGADLIKLGVIPKDSSSHLALITKERLAALRNKINSKLNNDTLGLWMPAVVKTGPEHKGTVTDPQIIREYAKPGMKVKITQAQDGLNLVGLEGILRDNKDSGKKGLGVEFDKPFPGGNDLEGNSQKGAGYGWYFAPQSVNLVLEPGQSIIEATDYELAKEVVADDKLGYRARFNMGLDNVKAWDSGNNKENINIPEKSLGMFSASGLGQGKKQIATIKFDNKIPGTGKQVYQFRLEDVANSLEYSSLGQMDPKDREEHLRKETIKDFFPRAVLNTKRGERVLISMLAGTDIILYGPPGSGKSQTAQDILDIAKQQKLGFIVEGCKANCNPFSLFDKEFAKVVAPCPECMIKYCPDFKKTGRFDMPKPEDVKVTVTNYDEGKGIEYLQCTTGLQHMHLAGYKIPPFDKTNGIDAEDDSNPQGYNTGVLVRTNNGVWFADEMDKVRQNTMDSLLEALNSQRIKPEQLRFTYPANAFIVGTANNHMVFSGPLNDRMNLLAIRYTDDPEVAKEITARIEGDKIIFLEDVPIGDTHAMKNDTLGDILIPKPIRDAVDSFYIKFRNEFNGEAKNEVSGTERSKTDARKAARAKLLLDSLFYSGAPKIVTVEEMIFGIQYSLCGKVQIADRALEQKSKQDLVDYLRKEFQTTLKQEEEVWWCNARKEIAIRQVQAPDIGKNLPSEFKLYEQNLKNAVASYKKLTTAYQPGATIIDQQARIDYPFMDYLFTEQPKMAKLRNEQLLDLMDYYIKSKKRSGVKIP